MSTILMQRPFLVDQPIAIHSQVLADSIRRSVSGKGIHLVATSAKSKLLAAHQMDANKIIAAAAALFLVLTI